MAQRDELAQPGELRAGKVAHVGEVFAITDHGAEGDEQHFGQRIEHTTDNARIGQGGKELFEPQDVLKVGLVLSNRGCRGVGEDRFHPYSHQ